MKRRSASPGGRLNEVYAVVREACDACLAEIRGGVPAVRPHEAAKRVIAEAGLDRHRVHTTGYGIAPGFPPSWGEPIHMFGGSTYVLEAGRSCRSSRRCSSRRSSSARASSIMCW